MSPFEVFTTTYSIRILFLPQGITHVPFTEGWDYPLLNASFFTLKFFNVLKSKVNRKSQTLA